MLRDLRGKLVASKTGRDAGIYLGSKFLTKFLALGLLPIWTSLLSPAEYGVIGTLYAWAGFLGPLFLLGLPNAVVRFYPDYRDDPLRWRAFLGNIGLFLFGVSVAIFLTSLLVGPWIWGLVSSEQICFWPLVPIMTASVLLAGFSRLGLFNFMASRSAIRAVSIEQALTTGSILASLFFVGALHWGVEGYLVGGLIGAAVVSLVVVGGFFYRKPFWRVSMADTKAALVYGLPLVPQALAAWVLNLSSRIMLERFRSLEETGFFTLAVNLSLVMSFVAVSLNQSMTPRYFELCRSEPDERKRHTVQGISVANLGVVGICGLGMMAAAPPVLLLLANVRFAEAVVYVVPVVTGYFFFGIYQMFLRPLLYEKRTKTVAAITVGGSLLNIAMNFFVIPKWGALGAACNMAVSYFAIAAVLVWFSRKHDKMGISLAIVVLFMALFVVAGFVFQSIPAEGIGFLGIRALVGVGFAAVVGIICWYEMRRKIPDAS